MHPADLLAVWEGPVASPEVVSLAEVFPVVASPVVAFLAEVFPEAAFPVVVSLLAVVLEVVLLLRVISVLRVVKESLTCVIRQSVKVWVHVSMSHCFSSLERVHRIRPYVTEEVEEVGEPEEELVELVEWMEE